MRKQYAIASVFGLCGIAILLALGVWQLKRLVWKRSVLTQIEAQISAPAVPIFSQPFTEFMPVTATGRITTTEAHVLTSRKPDGAGFRIVSVFETQGRRILLDRGYVPEIDKNAARSEITATIVGNFRTVDEADSFTPAADFESNYHFARDVPVLAAAFDTEPILIILRETSEENPPVRPWPVDTTSIPNNHLQYAITWFSLAIVWAGMTVFLLWRIRQRTV